MKRLGFIFVMVALIMPGAATAFVELQGLEPSPAMVDQPVSLLVRTGECDEVTGPPDVTVDGNAIDVLIPGNRPPDTAPCLFPVIDHEFLLGAFDSGTYIVTVRYQSIVGGTETVGVVNLTVEAAHSIPAGDWKGFLFMILLILILGVMAIRYRTIRGLMPLVLVFALLQETPAQPSSESHRLHVLLAHGAETPSPASIVEEWDMSSPPPITGLSVGDPVSVRYLLRLRAQGDSKALLDANPDTPRARLERLIVVEYPSEQDLNDALGAFESDTHVEATSIPTKFELSASSIMNEGGANYGWPGMNVGGAWQWAGGHALVGTVDMGLATEHPELRAFTSSNAFTWGNFLPAYSLDMSGYPSVDTDVDERKLESVAGPAQWCDTDANGMGRTEFVGHGTHVAGLIGANAMDANDVAGTCKHCGIGMWRFMFARCYVTGSGNFIGPDFEWDAVPESITFLGDIGAQVISLSLGGARQGAEVCANPGSDQWDIAMCNALAYVAQRNITVVGASGNQRTHVQFPASDARVVAVGGIDDQFELWDEHPGGITSCPYYSQYGDDRECGSNYTIQTGTPKQEVVAAARQVFGAMYWNDGEGGGFDWNPIIGCGDSFGSGPDDDGYGPCTGTSMAAPQISGILGILRSVNPLVPGGDPWNSGEPGVRDVLTSTTFQSQAGEPWDEKLGWGLPDARAAVQKMLGAVGGETVRNRATPLFGFNGIDARDHAYTTSPQSALAFLINNTANYAPLGTLVPGYSAFPDDPLLGAGDVPRANAFVMTTEYKARPDHPDLTPLFLLHRSRFFPVGCQPTQKACNTHNRDFLLATGVAELEALHAQGYDYRGIEGYVYERCTPDPDCVPQGAERLWRKCRTTDDDCAIFLENERLAFEANGYTDAVPEGFPMHIGYAYPNADTDGDGLIDGFEHLIGTDPTLADSDGDSTSTVNKDDGVEFPMAGVPVSDPCDGLLAHSNCRIDRIFANRFEAGPYLGPGMSATMPMSAAQACAEIDTQLTTYEQHLDEQSSTLDESDGEAWQQHLEEVAAVEEVRDGLDEYCE